MARLTGTILSMLVVIGGLTPCDASGQHAAKDVALTAKWQPYILGKLPTPEELPQLLSELSDLLGSRNPKLRDDTAYLLLSRWILRHNLPRKNDCLRLLNTWTSNLSYRLDASPKQRDEAALRRSFSALSLVLLVERDRQHAFLRRDTFHELVTKATNYMRLEPDERGYVPVLGWVHPTAHGADLLRHIAKSKRLEGRHHTTILDSITHRLQRLKLAFTAGEDNRLAHAIVELTQRQDFETATLKLWLTSLLNVRATGPQEHKTAFGHNRRLVVQAVMVRLALAAQQTNKTTANLGVVREALQGKLRKPR